MKYLKRYEDTTRDDTTRDEPQIGDYVVCQPINEDSKTELKVFREEISNVLKNQIGKLIQKQKSNNKLPNIDLYSIQYENLKLYHHKDHWWVHKEDIIFWSKNKQDCEIFLTANKYNL